MAQSTQVSDDDLRRYREDGYLLVRGLYDPDEIGILRETAEKSPALQSHVMALNDANGGVSKLTSWWIAGADLFGAFSRSPRIVDRVERLMGFGVYHYHSKVMLKEPKVGGAWSWHQDYGYWYNAGYLYPHMMSCLVAMDGARRDNGCLELLRGSHKMGRIEHVLTGDQAGADRTRVGWALEAFERVHAELEPGDALFFDSLTLHASAQNKSLRPRWSLICCYTATHNTPRNEPNHPGYRPLVRAPDDAIKAWRDRPFEKDPQFHHMGEVRDIYTNTKGR